MRMSASMSVSSNRCERTSTPAFVDAVVAHTLRRGRGRARRGRYAVGAHDPARCGSPSAGRPPTYYTHGAITPTGAWRGSDSSTHGPHQGRTGPRFLKDARF